MKIKVGYGSDPESQATWKYRIIDETISGKYVVCHFGTVKSISSEIHLVNWPLGLMDKAQLTDIREEEIEEISGEDFTGRI